MIVNIHFINSLPSVLDKAFVAVCWPLRVEECKRLFPSETKIDEERREVLFSTDNVYRLYEFLKSTGSEIVLGENIVQVYVNYFIPAFLGFDGYGNRAHVEYIECGTENGKGAVIEDYSIQKMVFIPEHLVHLRKKILTGILLKEREVPVVFRCTAPATKLNCFILTLAGILKEMFIQDGRNVKEEKISEHGLFTWRGKRVITLTVEWRGSNAPSRDRKHSVSTMNAVSDDKAFVWPRRA